MVMMKPSDLWRTAVEQRVRNVLKDGMAKKREKTSQE